MTMVVVDASIFVVTRATPLVPLLTLVLRGLVPSTARNMSLLLSSSLFFSLSSLFSLSFSLSSLFPSLSISFVRSLRLPFSTYSTSSRMKRSSIPQATMNGNHVFLFLSCSLFLSFRFDSAQCYRKPADSTRHNLFDARSTREDRTIARPRSAVGFKGDLVTLYDSATIPARTGSARFLERCTYWTMML